jgi:hypothetical protein
MSSWRNLNINSTISDTSRYLLKKFTFSKLFLAGVIALFASMVSDAYNYARGVFGTNVYSLIPIILVIIGLGLVSYDFWRRMH